MVSGYTNDTLTVSTNNLNLNQLNVNQWIDNTNTHQQEQDETLTSHA